MIQANELRIGNIIGCKLSNDAGMYTVSGIDGWRRVFETKEDERIYNLPLDKQFKEMAPKWHDERLIRISGGAREGEQYIESKLKAIPLTQEWLIKLGFKKWGRDDMPRTISYEFGELKIFPANNCCDFKGFGFMWYKPDVNKIIESARFKFQYVHELQNLHYALSKTELTLKY